MGIYFCGTVHRTQAGAARCSVKKRWERQVCAIVETLQVENMSQYDGR
jgi:hypothetical protein